jgi:hypothetical protein
MATLTQTRQRVQYKTTGSFNIVSVLLVLLAASSVYFAYYTWPVFLFRLHAKGQLQEMLPRLYKANLSPYGMGREAMAIKQETMTRLRGIGIQDPRLTVAMEYNKALIAFEAHYTTVIRYPVIDRTYGWKMVVRAETSAARVEW